MRGTSPWRTRIRVAVSSIERNPLRSPAGRPLSPVFGLEALDQMGIDIDQDPRAFARFLEIQNRVQEGR
jgi:hypothetical protein